MIGYTNFAEIAAKIPDYSGQDFNDARARLYAAHLTVDSLKVGNYELEGHMVLQVWHDEYADSESDTLVEALVRNNLQVWLPDHEETYIEVPIDMLADRPSYEDIVDAINADLDTWRKYIVINWSEEV
ncbi:PASTA domain-containing protein [Hymenobacter fodinae]|uniref:Uncharacterized protein n=1 Tax=Hymenobacter fodinae TaxID=2510796 RepID=A0A4Z0P0D6_9BACT|nr:hypothetical protein [Hymenobacter fodinae]TGE04605.1 hypothetical protein EU556_20690 [Hymenobacter fodinae]